MSPALDAPLEFLRTLWALSHALDSRSKTMARAGGVTSPQRMVLRVLSRAPGAAGVELARLLHLHPSTLTGVLRRLEAKKLVRRAPDEHDARRFRFYVTPKGERALTGQQHTVEAVVRRVLAHEAPRSVAEVQRMIRRITAGLEAAPSPKRR